MSSPQSAAPPGGVGLAEAPDAAALLGRPPLVLLGLRVALRPPSRPAPPARPRPGLRLARAGVVGEPARLVLGARDGVGQHGGVEHRGVERGAAPARPARAPRPRPATAPDARAARPGPAPCVARRGDVRLGAGQRRRAAGDGDGRHGGDADAAQHGRGQDGGTGDACDARRAPSPPELPTSGSGRVGNARRPRGERCRATTNLPDPTAAAGRPVGETGGWGVPCPSRDRVVMNPLMNLGPLPARHHPACDDRAAPRAERRSPDLTAATPPASCEGNTAHRRAARSGRQGVVHDGVPRPRYPPSPTGPGGRRRWPPASCRCAASRPRRPCSPSCGG